MGKKLARGVGPHSSLWYPPGEVMVGVIEVSEDIDMKDVRQSSLSSAVLTTRPFWFDDTGGLVVDVGVFRGDFSKGGLF